MVVIGLVLVCGLLLTMAAKAASTRASVEHTGTPPAASLRANYAPFENVQPISPVESSIKDSAVADNSAIGSLALAPRPSGIEGTDQASTDNSSVTDTPNSVSGEPAGSEESNRLKLPDSSLLPSIPILLVLVLAVGSAWGLYLIVKPSRS